MSVVNAIPFIAAGDDGYSLSRSLRFRSSASAYLNRTPSSAGNQTTWTFNCWIKRGVLSSGTQNIFSAGNNASGTRFNLFYLSGDNLRVDANGTASVINTTPVYRDASAWYMLTLVWDTTQATTSNRVKLYINGSQVTVFNASSYPSLNATSDVNSTKQHFISQDVFNNSDRFDGYLAEVNFIDGQALTPSSFGAFSIYNQWLPKKYSGTYGTNGFYLPFTNNASTTTLGYDFSPQGNNWTTNNISVTAGVTYDSMTDVPTLTSATAANYAVLNPLDKGTTITVQSGNLEASISTTHNGVRNTFQVPTTGKWYWEITNGSTTGSNVILSFGLATSVASMNTYDYNTTGTYSLYASTDLQIISNGSGGITFGSAISSGTVCGIAYDATNGQLYLAVANTYYNSAGSGTGDPAGGTNATMAVASSLGLFPYEHIYADTFNANFGQRPFTYTPPTGYVALNTFNL